MYVHIYIYKYTHTRTHTHTHTHRSHQDDVQYLESQMVTLKKENHKLKRELEDTATGTKLFVTSTETLSWQRLTTPYY